ncbi:MAG: LptF/LptG family permease [Bacteroidaceae bacterium]
MRQKLRKSLQKMSYRIPVKRLDMYIIKKFLGTYIFSILLIVTIAIIFDYNERIDKFTQSQAPVKKIIFDYYLNFIPYFSNLFSPLFVFISVIFFTSKLADNSEIIAMKSTGMSFRRLLRPYMLSAGIISVLTFMLGSYVIPKGNRAKTNFENKYIVKKNVKSAENIQIQVDTGVVAFVSHYDNETKTGYNFSLDKFVNKKLVSHLTARVIQYDTLSDKRYRWTISNYQVRELKGMRETMTTGDKIDSIIMMEPSDLVYTRNQQQTMTSPELKDFIEKQKLRGSANVGLFEIEYYKRFAGSFAAFILTIIGASLSCEKRKGGMGLSLGIGLALSFTYILLEAVFATFATKAGWPPQLSVWIPNILFSFIALYLYRKTPK